MDRVFETDKKDLNQKMDLSQQEIYQQLQYQYYPEMTQTPKIQSVFKDGNR